MEFCRNVGRALLVNKAVSSILLESILSGIIPVSASAEKRKPVALGRCLATNGRSVLSHSMITQSSKRKSKRIHCA